MKSGSTYVAEVLSRCTGASLANSYLPADYWSDREQILLLSDIKALPSPAVLQMHARAHRPNLDAIRELGIKVVYLWRNLGDTIISFDDHVLNEAWENPVCFIDNMADYAAQDMDARHTYLIRHRVPWYISFYLTWRQVGEPE